jgi:hypothetical protein
MSDKDDAVLDEDEEVHLEWWYDLDRPFLAEVDLLAARPAYSTPLITEDGIFPASVPVPRTAPIERGIASFLAPPLDWMATAPEPDERWGTHSEHDALGFKGVAINRLAFSVHADSALVEPVIRAEWGQELLAQEVLHNIDAWWENVRTWLEIATNQRIAQVGHEANDWLNRARACYRGDLGNLARLRGARGNYTSHGLDASARRTSTPKCRSAPPSRH